MKVYDNGNYRDATPEELTAWEKAMQDMPEPTPTPEERLDDLEEALDMILNGVTE